jgi:hypothetical protein
LTGGYEKASPKRSKYDRQYPGRFAFTDQAIPVRTDYRVQAQAIGRHIMGTGLRFQDLGLYLRENITAGTLVRSTIHALIPCGMLRSIEHADPHLDPVAFLTPPIVLMNDRELNNHPDWSFHGKDFPPPS